MASPLWSSLRDGDPEASDCAAFVARGVDPPLRSSLPYTGALPAPARASPAPPPTPSPKDSPLRSPDVEESRSTRVQGPVPRLLSSQDSLGRSPAPQEERSARASPVPHLPSPPQGSPGRLPVQEQDRLAGRAVVPRLPSPPQDSPGRLPAREEDRPTRPASLPHPSSLLQDSSSWSPAHEPGRPVGLNPAPPQKDSPPRDGGGHPVTPTPLADLVEKPPSPATSIVNRAAKEDPRALTKVERGIEGGPRDGPDAERGSRVVSWIVRRRRMGETVGRAAIGVRLCAVVLSLVSFSVMAADKTKGWAGDSFDRYREYRFCITVNILTFIYSGFQAYAQVHRLVYGKDTIRPPVRYYFDFAMDQVLAYLLVAASSAAATRNDDWVSNWGNDPFTVMANGSISVSFLAFVALAVSALISAHNLFSRDS